MIFSISLCEKCTKRNVCILTSGMNMLNKHAEECKTYLPVDPASFGQPISKIEDSGISIACALLNVLQAKPIQLSLTKTGFFIKGVAYFCHPYSHV